MLNEKQIQECTKSAKCVGKFAQTISYYTGTLNPKQFQHYRGVWDDLLWLFLSFFLSFFLLLSLFFPALHVCVIRERPLTMGIATWSHHYIHSSVSLFLWDEDSASDSVVWISPSLCLSLIIYNYKYVFYLCESQPEKVLVLEFLPCFTVTRLYSWNTAHVQK